MADLKCNVRNATLIPSNPPPKKKKKQVEQTKRMVENPKEAEKFLRDTMEQGAGAGEKAKAEAGSVAARFERFKAALKEEVSRDFGGGTGASASGTTSGVRYPNARPNTRRKRT